MSREAGKEKEITIRKAAAAAAFLIPAFFLLDRFSKTLVLNRLSEGEGVAVWPGVFHITRVNNTGAAFGMFKESGPLLALVSTVSVLVFSVFFFWRLFAPGGRRSFPGASTELFAWALVIAGASGNLYDRMRYGYVIDFLDLRVWPVFNVADAAICTGAALLALGLFRCTR